MDRFPDLAAAFVEAASVPRGDWHGSGTLDEAAALLAAHPEIATGGIHVAALLGDDATVRRFLAEAPTLSRAAVGPRGWDALTYLCFSRYLRLDPARSDGFLRAAEALLDAGADPSTGWFETAGHAERVWESALYGVAGVARHEGLTRLLLARGADPNDDETPYHAAETHAMGVLQALVESGRLNQDSLTTLLLRKTDWHHAEGVSYLLARGADPNRITRWGKTALQNALLRDNGLGIVQSLLDHGADPDMPGDSGHGMRGPLRSAASIAARRGRGDVLEAIEGLGIPLRLSDLERLVAACARDDGETLRRLVAAGPELIDALLIEGGTLLADFAGNGNTAGVRQLLDLGVDVAARQSVGDPYFGIAPESTALHVAAWRGRHATVRLLLSRGAPVNAPDGEDRTPLMLAVKACIDSDLSAHRSLDSIQALRAAGASLQGIPHPSGDPEADALLAAHR
jgi:ankyrin repeat protein